MSHPADPATLLSGAAALTAVVAAARGTWSPCGISMLSSITPLAERGRGHRYRSTAAWFVAGAVAGGLTLGMLGAILAAAVRAIGPGPATVAALGGAAALVAAASDARVARFHLPVHRRQVNERWLDQFRPWVYGAGFGWQIGVGLATYITSAAVYLMVTLVALTGRPTIAVATAALFGLVRGLAVLLGRRITGFEQLARLHRTMAELDGAAVAVVVATDVAVAAACGWYLSPWAALGVLAGSTAVALLRVRHGPAARARTAQA